jgi:hypothetical protein
MQRCKAKSKRSGEQCKNYALKKWAVCRMHGTKGGPKTRKGLIKCTIVPFKHGYYGQETRQEVEFMRKLLKGQRTEDSKFGAPY